MTRIKETLTRSLETMTRVLAQGQGVKQLGQRV